MSTPLLCIHNVWCSFETRPITGSPTETVAESGWLPLTVGTLCSSAIFGGCLLAGQFRVRISSTWQHSDSLWAGTRPRNQFKCTSTDSGTSFNITNLAWVLSPGVPVSGFSWHKQLWLPGIYMTAPLQWIKTAFGVDVRLGRSKVMMLIDKSC